MYEKVCMKKYLYVRSTGNKVVNQSGNYRLCLARIYHTHRFGVGGGAIIIFTVWYYFLNIYW